MRGLAGSGAAKVKHLFGLCKGFAGKNVQGECKKASLLVFLPSRSHFYAKSEEMKAVFNRCWVFRDAKCGICKPKLGIYKPYWTVREGQGVGPCPASSFFVTFEIIFLNIPTGQ